MQLFISISGNLDIIFTTILRLPFPSHICPSKGETLERSIPENAAADLGIVCDAASRQFLFWHSTSKKWVHSKLPYKGARTSFCLSIFWVIKSDMYILIWCTLNENSFTTRKSSRYSSPPQLRYPQLHYFCNYAILNWVQINSS